MSRWPTTRLGDLVRFVGGGTPSRDKAEYWNGNIPWASVKDLQSLEIERTVETITEDGLRNSASNVVPRNTVVIASRVGLGKVSITLRPMAINQDLKALVPFSGEILPRFLLYYFVAIADQIEGAGVGATVKGVTIEYLEKLEVPFPSLSDQHRIVGILDEAEALCRLRALADQRTSSIEAALFLEVFGSPAINPFDWPVESVGALYEESRGGVKCGPFGSALKKHEYTDSGVPVWGIPNVLPNQFVEAGSLYISHPKFEELRAYAVEPGDLLISRAGTVGEDLRSEARGSRIHNWNEPHPVDGFDRKTESCRSSSQCL